MNWKTILNPLEKFSEKTLLLAGIVSLFIGSWVGFLMNARFDGIIDLHLVDSIVWYEPLLDNVLNAVSLFVLFLIFGKVINPKTRAIDVLNASLICRIPMYVLSLTNLGGYLQAATNRIMEGMNFDNLENAPSLHTSDLVMLLFMAIASIGLVILMITLFWKGFKTSTNSKGIKNIVMFTVLFLIAEVVSKLLIAGINS